MADYVEIAVAADANYFDGMLVTVASVAINASQDLDIRFHVLDGGIRDADYAFMVKRIVELHPRATFARHVIDDSVFKDFPTWAGSGRMTYARLLLPRLLPDVEHVLYLDCDILWTRDVADIWREKRKDIVYQAVHENWPYILKKESRWFAARDLKFVPGEYLTAGLSFFNLGEFRRLRLDEKAMSFLSRHRDVQWVDQSALNALIWTEELPVSILTPDWACTIWLMTDEILSTHPVLHFAGTAPWKSLIYNRLLTDVMLEWYKVDAIVRRCSVWQSLRRHYSALRIISSRLIFKVAASGFLGKRIFRMLLTACGKSGACKDLETLLYRWPNRGVVVR